jgi:hypothetical protein
MKLNNQREFACVLYTNLKAHSVEIIFKMKQAFQLAYCIFTTNDITKMDACVLK